MRSAPTRLPAATHSKWAVHPACFGEGIFFSLNSKPQLSQLLSNVALCPKGVLPKSCSQDSLNLCPSAFQIITWVALPSNLDFAFLFLPLGDHQPARTCCVSLARDSAVVLSTRVHPSLRTTCSHTAEITRIPLDARIPKKACAKYLSPQLLGQFSFTPATKAPLH